MSSDFAVILVDSTSHAMRIEKLLTSRGITCKLVPVPRHLSSVCGVCVRVQKRDIEEVKSLIDAHHVVIRSIEAL